MVFAKKVGAPDETEFLKRYVCFGYNGPGVAMSTAMGPELAHRVMGGKTAHINSRSPI